MGSIITLEAGRKLIVLAILRVALVFAVWVSMGDWSLDVALRGGLGSSVEYVAGILGTRFIGVREVVLDAGIVHLAWLGLADTAIEIGLIGAKTV